MLMPKRVKYRRVQRGRMTGKATRGNKVTYGEFGLQAQEPSWITSNQIEAARVAMTRYTKRGGQVWIKIFPVSPSTRRRLPPESKERRENQCLPQNCSTWLPRISARLRSPMLFSGWSRTSPCCMIP